MTLPNWYGVLLLALAAWRTFNLVALDDITDRPRRYVTGLGWGWKEGQPLPRTYREWLADWIQCPYCLGAWVAIGWFVAYEIWPQGTLITAVPFALSAGVIAVHQFLSAE